MSDEQFSMLMALFRDLGFITGGLMVVIKWFETLKVRYKEKSVGDTKVSQLINSIEELRHEQETLHSDNIHLKGIIEKLVRDYDRLVDNMLAFMGKK